MFLDFAARVEEGDPDYEPTYSRVVKAVEVARWGRLIFRLYRAIAQGLLQE